MLEQMAHASCVLCSQNCRRIHGNGSRRGASFPGFAVVVNRSCLDEDFLSVPTGFADDLREMLDEAWEMQEGCLYLEGPSGRRWPVATCEVSLAFVEGWHSFATDNSLEAGDVLFFKVIDSLVLAVSVFDAQGSAKMKLFPGSNTSSCNEASGLDQSQKEQPSKRRFRRLCKAAERSGTSSAALSVQPKEEPCSDELWSHADQAAALEQPLCSGEKRALGPRKLHFGTPEEDSGLWEEYLAPTLEEVPGYKQVKEELVDLDQWEEFPNRNQVKQEIVDLDQREEVPDWKQVKQEVVDLDMLAEVPGRKEVKHEVIDLDQLGEEATPATPVKQVAVAVGRGSQKRVHSMMSVLERCFARDTKQPGGESARSGDLDVDRSTLKGFGFHSARRQVTEEEIKAALQRAEAKVRDCKHPAFSIRMMKSHVLRGFWLGLPDKLCKHLGRANRLGWLVDGQGRRTSVKYISENRSGGGLSAGWGGFARKRTLDLDDVCVFELVDKAKFILQIHIFRVVDFDDSDMICKHLRSPRGSQMLADP